MPPLQPYELAAITRLSTGGRRRRKQGAKGTMTETPSGPQEIGQRQPVGQYRPEASAYASGPPSSFPQPANWGGTSAMPGNAPPVTELPTSAYE